MVIAAGDISGCCGGGTYVDGPGGVSTHSHGHYGRVLKWNLLALRLLLDVALDGTNGHWDVEWGSTFRLGVTEKLTKVLFGMRRVAELCLSTGTHHTLLTVHEMRRKIPCLALDHHGLRLLLLRNPWLRRHHLLLLLLLLL